MALTSPGGDQLAVSIGATGQTTIKFATAKRKELGSITVRGLTHAEATSKSRGFWGRLWDGIKAAANKVIDAVTFGIGGATCRPSASVGMKGQRVTQVTVGISCTN
jgi:hypothetical protein